ncbi:hypothetical protein [Clostridium sp.]|nr:hypothetical protein [Clostridium sp.]
MTKITIKFILEEEKQRIIKALSVSGKINKISKVYETGKYKKVYIDIE